MYSLQGGIIIQNNQVSFHPKTTTIVYTNIEKISNKYHNATSHQINKIEKQKDCVINDYLKQLRNASKIKKPYIRSEKKGNYKRRPTKILE